MLHALIVGLILHLGATLQGTVRAEGTREPIAHARVTIEELGRVAASDAQGYFVIADVPEGRWVVEATALGYDTVRLDIVSSGTGALRLDFVLPRRPVRLGEVPVQSEAVRSQGSVNPVTDAGPPPARLAGPGRLKYIPGLIEADVLRALQQLPSVGAMSDFSSAMYVRGGASDQNLILLDGVPLFNPYHVGGVFSAVNADAVAGVDLWAGAQPAREGDRLGGSVHIATRDGGRDRTRASGAVGLLSSNATVDGPLGNRGSYLVSVRRTYLDAATRGLYAIGVIDQAVPYGFWDTLLKGTHEVGELGRLDVTAYVNREGISVPSRMRDQLDADAQLGWGSLMAAVAFRRPLGAHVMWNSRIGISDFTGRFDMWDWPTESQCDESGCVEFPSGDTVHTIEGATTARDVMAESELTWYGGSHTLSFGARYDVYDFRHRLHTDQVEKMVPRFRSSSGESTIASFVEDEWRVTDGFALRGGLRVLHAGSLGTAWLPRIGARLRLTQDLVLTSGAGIYAQALRSMRTDESVVSSFIAYDVFTMQPARAGLARSRDVVLGLHLDRGATSVRLDAYAKEMTGLVLPVGLADPLDLPPLVTDTFVVGTGTAAGIEVAARHTIGRFEIAGSYAYSRAWRSADGDTYIPRFERRHVADASLLVPWGQRGLISARATFGTGQPYTPVVGVSAPYRFDPVTGKYMHAGSGALIMGEYNSRRLPPYFRLDVAARRTYDVGWFGQQMQVTPYFQVLNVLNTRNVLVSEPQTWSRSYSWWPQLPIFPTFGLEWRF